MITLRTPERQTATQIQRSLSAGITEDKTSLAAFHTANKTVICPCDEPGESVVNRSAGGLHCYDLTTLLQENR